jgi:hypothetical protein
MVALARETARDPSIDVYEVPLDTALDAIQLCDRVVREAGTP